ncbi:TetR family transcriptional regulator [Calothrix sp. NIES-2100]|uniref:TetR/AcrR family transcriptional regulator n=1 Tax=Calothrix sp. NIES-2100 TaxID=1954172 RepID=UPI000B611779|nr:TetR family transcriptional regulator [Calothrix sp. NIES-2100]
MARLPKITNQQILEAATEVFLEKGFGGSTQEIARKAGISEASIFKRFSTKEELFFAAMGIPETPPWVNQLESLSGKGELKANLNQVCVGILEFYRDVMPRMMMLRAKGNALPEMGLKLESKPIRDVKVLTSFLEFEIKQGRLRPCQPQAIAHILLGSLMNHVLLEQISSPESLPTDELVFVDNLVDILWQGISPR